MNNRLRAALTALVLALSTAVAAPAAAAVQTLTWTASGDTTHYQSAPTTAVAGETTIVWENSEATGNTIGMPHTLTFDTSTEGYNHDVSINILASPFDADSGRHTATVTLTPGRYRYFCSIPGHSTMVGEFTVTSGGGGEDTTPPTVTAQVTGTQNPNGDYAGSATVTVTATDSGSGVDTVEYQIDDTGYEPYTEPVTVTEVGDHSVQFRATDKAGNTSPAGSVAFRVAEPGQQDTTPPTVTSTVSGEKDQNGAYIGTATVALTAEDASGVARIEYNVDGGAFGTYTAPVVVSGVGAHMVHYRATDNAGNTSAEQMAMFTIVAPSEPDTTPPTVTSAVGGDREPDGDYIGTATVTITATDADSGVALVEYALDGAAWAAYTQPVVVGTVGAHTVKYRATDKAGNTSGEGTTSFTVVAAPEPDTTPPSTSATVTGERDGNGAYRGAATVTVTAADEGSGVRRIEFALDSGAWTTYTEPVTVRTVGDHTVGYRAVDNAGNTSAAESVTFTVVPSGEDGCPASDTRATVIIRADDTGVPNKDTGNGCTINDLIDEYGDYPTHAAFVRHVEAVTAPLVPGSITKRQQGAIVQAAARSVVGS